MEKYRALRTDGKGWTYFMEKYHIPYKNLPDKSDFKHEVDLSTLGRYTGRRDRYGILIFGGDYVEEDGIIYRVCFQERFPRIYHKSIGYRSIDTLDFEFCKVIGNIFEK